MSMSKTLAQTADALIFGPKFDKDGKDKSLLNCWKLDIDLIMNDHSMWVTLQNAYISKY